MKIVIPRKLTFDGLPLFNGENPIFRRGDKIEVSLGYVPNITKVFSGYIKSPLAVSDANYLSQKGVTGDLYIPLR